MKARWVLPQHCHIIATDVIASIHAKDHVLMSLHWLQFELQFPGEHVFATVTDASPRFSLLPQIFSAQIVLNPSNCNCKALYSRTLLLSQRLLTDVVY